MAVSPARRLARADELAFAHQLADIADRISMARFRAPDLRVDEKPDTSPVTETDLAVEEALVEHIRLHRPGDDVVGEELGGSGEASGSPRRWVIDPIDGTKSYIRGNETWGTLIALQEEGRTAVAVASTPAFGQRYHAVRGEGAHANGRRIRVSRVAHVEEALLAHTNVHSYAAIGMDAQFLALAERCWECRGFGNSVGHLSVARGSADIAWTPRGQLWDFAALKLIVEEAGGVFTDVRGDRSVERGTGISSNGLLHTDVLAILRG